MKRNTVRISQIGVRLPSKQISSSSIIIHGSRLAGDQFEWYGVSCIGCRLPFNQTSSWQSPLRKCCASTAIETLSIPDVCYRAARQSSPTLYPPAPLNSNG